MSGLPPRTMRRAEKNVSVDARPTGRKRDTQGHHGISSQGGYRALFGESRQIACESPTVTFLSSVIAGLPWRTAILATAFRQPSGMEWQRPAICRS
jgi:hypothetical protein